MNKTKFLISVGLMCLSCLAGAMEFKGVTMTDNIKIGEQSLILNGMGLREVKRFGIPIKVYVGGLYLVKKSSDSSMIIKSDDSKQLVMQFVRNVDRDSLLDAFQAGYKDNCVQECDSQSKQFKPFGVAIVSVRKDNKITFIFHKDSLEFEVDGPNAKKITFTDPNLSRNILSLFINEKKPPTEEFRRGLLGLGMTSAAR